MLVLYPSRLPSLKILKLEAVSVAADIGIRLFTRVHACCLAEETRSYELEECGFAKGEKRGRAPSQLNFCCQNEQKQCVEMNIEGRVRF